ncbi:MAG: aldo/keto reductase [Dehalococcoidia bacterium]
MQYRQLGRTGVSLSVLGVGGGALGLTKAGDEGAAAILSRALALGITCVDTATAYGRGISEERIGRWLPGRRDRVFLATKLDQCDHEPAARELRESLARLGTETIDLVQVHAVNDSATLDRILGAGGVVAALEEARAAGAVRFIGITGHRDPDILRQALERYDFDTVLMPAGCMDGSEFLDAVGPLARERGTGLLGMKVFGHGAIAAAGQPALVYALGQAVSSLVIGMNSLAELEENAQTAAGMPMFANDERARLAELAREARTPERQWWRHELAAV